MNNIRRLYTDTKTVRLFDCKACTVKAGLNDDSDGDVIIKYEEMRSDDYIYIPKDQKYALLAALLKQIDLRPDWGDEPDSQIMGAILALFKSDNAGCYKTIQKFLAENNIKFQKTFWADSYE